jgi:hypothetical protein
MRWGQVTLAAMGLVHHTQSGGEGDVHQGLNGYGCCNYDKKFWEELIAYFPW